MSIEIIAEGAHDVAHSVFESREILKKRPDAVFLELPSTPFQKILSAYSSGKLTDAQLKKKLLAAISAEKKEIDHDLVDKFIVGELEMEELESIETEGREFHVMKSAKKVGAELHAVDIPLDKLDPYLTKKVKEEHLEMAKVAFSTKRLPFIAWELADLFHYPFYFLERLVRNPSIKITNPFIHNINENKMAKLGAKYDRWVQRLVLPLFMHMPLSRELKDAIKVGYILGEMDVLRERFMAAKITKRYRELEKELGREPNIIVIVHLWSSAELERLLP